jgi:uncharacterized protein YdeI (YjbR/CyaY-like superfamily)
MAMITVFTRQEFRQWLMKNHNKGDKISVILFKRHTKKPAPSHKQLIEEAICFGWIDTTIKRLDKNRYVRNFSKRNKNSTWSRNTLKYAKELIKQKKMTPVGLKFYKEGLRKPPHDSGIPKNPSMPPELKKVLDKEKKAKKNFKELAPSTKKMLYRWILRGKRNETRNKRISIIVERTKADRKDFFKTQKKLNIPSK